MKVNLKDSFGKENSYTIVESFPTGYILWNIGRHNLPLEGYIPLVRTCYHNPYWIIPESKSVLKVDSEELALFLIAKAHSVEINKRNFQEMVELFEHQKMEKEFESFKTTCELFAISLRKAGHVCTTKCNLYKDHNWFCCSFDVDKFGGSACQIKYIENSYRFTNYEETFSCDTLQQALMYVPYAVRKTMKVRLTPELADFINSQND